MKVGISRGGWSDRGEVTQLAPVDSLAQFISGSSMGSQHVGFPWASLCTYRWDISLDSQPLPIPLHPEYSRPLTHWIFGF